MDQPFVVHMLQNLQNRRQHAARLVGRQRPLRQNLCEIFLGILLHHIEQRRAIEVAASCLKNAQQIRMSQFADRLPAQQLLFRVRRVYGNQFDGGLPGIARTASCEKYGAVIGTAQIGL